MSVQAEIIQALKPLGIPVSTLYAPTGQNAPPTYAVIYELMEQPEIRADDRERLTGHYCQVDFIGKTNITALVRRATKLLSNAGFIRRDTRAEYLPDAKEYRHMLRIFMATDTDYEEET